MVLNHCNCLFAISGNKSPSCTYGSTLDGNEVAPEARMISVAVFNFQGYLVDLTRKVQSYRDNLVPKVVHGIYL